MILHLGSNITSNEEDALIRILKALSALDQLQTLWKSTLPKQIKKGILGLQLNQCYSMDLPHGLALSDKKTNLMEHIHTCYMQS